MSVASALDSSVLVLNRLFMAVQVVSARRAFAMLCKEIAEVMKTSVGGAKANYHFAVEHLRKLAGGGEHFGA